MQQLEEQRIIINDKIKNCGALDSVMAEDVRTGFNFLENPQKYRASAGLEGKGMVLKATFSGPLGITAKEDLEPPLSRSHSRF
ncbi:MAG: hypothetical protein ABW189_02665 [Rickettsiales bacterium]